MLQKRALIIEDEESSRLLCEMLLQKRGLETFSARNAVSALALIDQHQHFDLILLDLNLPDADGIELAGKIASAGPIIMMSIRTSAESRASGFRSGAKDYISKPFHPDELLFRIENLLADAKQEREAIATTVQIGHWKFDSRVPQLVDLSSGASVHLTAGEYRILTHLLQAEGYPVSRQQLSSLISRNREKKSSKSIDVLISRLRKKVEIDPRAPRAILTVKGVGYQLVSSAA